MDTTPKKFALPAHGINREEISRRLLELRENDADWRKGRTGAYVFWASDDILEVAKEAHLAYFSENGLSPKAFPSLHFMEDDVLRMTGSLLQGERAVGSMTSGGTESIMVAVKTARDLARVERGIVNPEIVMPQSAHPAFSKAAHYLGMTPIRTELDPDFRASVPAMEAAITSRTVLIVGSAPQYPHGVIDPIPELGRIALERGTCLHVDACVGGFFLPFLRQLEDGVERFDFSVSGVTSISADLHKFGFTAKGASTILYRDQEIKKYQGFDFTDWPIGQYSSPTVTGTRPAGPIAAAWAVLNYLGNDGYLALNRKIMGITRALWDGINSVPGLQVWGQPVMSCFGYGSHEVDMSGVATGMSQRGWFVNVQAEPPGIHMFVTPAHEAAVEQYVHDLGEVVDQVLSGEIESDGRKAAYN